MCTALDDVDDSSYDRSNSTSIVYAFKLIHWNVYEKIGISACALN